MKDQVTAFLQRHPGVFVIVAVVALAGVSLMVGRGGPGTSSADPDEIESTSTTPADDAGDGADDARVPSAGDAEVLDGTGDPDAGDDLTGGADWDEADVPTDVAHSRDPVDLDSDPPADDVTEVGRWWAATYVAYVGAEPGDDLLDRLESHTTDNLADNLADDLAAAPATYTEPLPIEGVSVGEPMVEEEQEAEGQQVLRVTVETANALAIYDMTLVDEDGRWMVDGIADL